MSYAPFPESEVPVDHGGNAMLRVDGHKLGLHLFSRHQVEQLQVEFDAHCLGRQHT